MSKQTTKISLRLSADKTAKIDEVARSLSQQASGLPVSRADVLRLALERLLSEPAP